MTLLGFLVAVAVALLLFFGLRWLIVHSPFNPNVNRMLMIALWVVAVIVVVWFALVFFGFGGHVLNAPLR